MNRQQAYLLELLREIHGICAAHGIVYYIGMGTLLGAVRNGGFLPWDDDADILMTYENWERFKEVCETALPEGRYLGSADRHESYGHLLPRYVSCDTTMFHTSQSLHDDVAGQVIDIFVLDPIADGEEAYAAYLQDLYLYSSLVNYANVAGYKFEIDAERFKRHLDRIHREGQVAVIREVEQMLASHFDDAGARYAFRWQGVPICFKRSWFDEVAEVEFEGEKFMAPGCINEFLTCYYGEEWVEVPGAVSPAKHNVAASLAFPYTEALEFYRPTLDREALRAGTESRRYELLAAAPVNNWVKDQKAQARSAVIAAETALAVERRRAEFDRALASRDVRSLEPFVAAYLAWQTDPLMIGFHGDKGMYRYAHPLLAPVPDDVFEAGLVVLMGTGRLRRATRLLGIRRDAGLPLSDAMAALERDLARFQTAMGDCMRGRVSDGLAKTRDLCGRYPFVSAFLELECVLLRKRYEASAEEGDLGALDGAVQAGLSAFPGNGFYEKLQGDVLLARGERERAQELYLAAAERTRNGMELHDIAVKTGYNPTWLRNPAWAKEAGVAQWDGPEPDLSGLPQPARNAPAPAADCRVECLVGLLGEVAAECERLGIAYVLAPQAARLLSEGRAAQLATEDFAIVCRSNDVSTLAAGLRESHPEGRALAHGKEDAESGLRLMRYHDLGSLRLNLAAKSAPKMTTLFVIIAPFDQGQRKRGLLASLLERRAGKAGASGVAFTGSGAFDCKAAWIDDWRYLDWDGRRFRVPCDLEAYLDASGIRGKRPARAGKLLESGAISYEELLASGALAPDYFERKASVREANERGKAVLEEFRLNFEQMKLAVRLKELSLELLPRKAEIVGMHEAGDVKGLCKVLKPYLACVRHYEGIGDLSFDDDIYRIMRTL